MTRNGVDLGSDAIRAFCQKWRIRELDVFGSLLRDDFRPDSDIDFLAEFDTDAHMTFTDVLDMEDELSAIVGRPVDIVDRKSVV